MDVLTEFGTDAALEAEGVWVDLGDGTAVKIARLENPKHEAALKRLRKPYRSIFQSGRQLPPDVEDKIEVESMADAILLGWRGLKYGGVELPFSPENARKVLQVKDFRKTVWWLALQGETFRKQSVEDAAKNSPAS